MDIKINFYQAATRHFFDAEFLFTHQRNVTAGHLYGFAAECGIKTFLDLQGFLELDSKTGDIQKNKEGRRFRVHINQLIQEINSLAVVDGRNAGKYLAMIPKIGDFSDWDPQHRYYSVVGVPESTENWRNAALEVMAMLDQIKLDGGVPR